MKRMKNLKEKLFWKLPKQKQHSHVECKHILSHKIKIPLTKSGDIEIGGWWLGFFVLMAYQPSCVC